MTTIEEAARQGATVTARAEVRMDGELVATPHVVDGRVSYDLSRRRLRSCDVTLLPADGTLPSQPDDPLAPQTQTLHLHRTATLDGQTWEEPVGVYVIEQVDLDREAGTVALTGFDASLLVSDARWEEPYRIARGTPVVDAIVDAILARAPFLDPGQVETVDGLTDTTPRITWGEEVSNDPWDDVQALAESSGLWVRFDRRGHLVVDLIPDIDTVDPVWDYRVGVESTLTGLSRRLVGRPYNVVVARGEPEGDDPVVEAIAEDLDPASPSHVARYRRPYWLVSRFIREEGQAGRAARGQLRRLVSTGDEVTIRSVPVPTRDVWDVVAAHDPRLGLDARYVVDRVELPLGPDEMTLTCRRRAL